MSAEGVSQRVDGASQLLTTRVATPDANCVITSRRQPSSNEVRIRPASGDTEDNELLSDLAGSRRTSRALAYENAYAEHRSKEPNRDNAAEVGGQRYASLVMAMEDGHIHRRAPTELDSKTHGFWTTEGLTASPEESVARPLSSLVIIHDYAPRRCQGSDRSLSGDLDEEGSSEPPRMKQVESLIEAALVSDARQTGVGSSIDERQENTHGDGAHWQRVPLTLNHTSFDAADVSLTSYRPKHGPLTRAAVEHFAMRLATAERDA